MKSLIDKTGQPFTFRQHSPDQPAVKNSKSFRTSAEAQTFLQQFPSVQLRELVTLFSDDQTPLTDMIDIQTQAIKNLCDGHLVVTDIPGPLPASNRTPQNTHRHRTKNQTSGIHRLGTRRPATTGKAVPR